MMAVGTRLDSFEDDGVLRREPRYSLLLCVKLLTGAGPRPAKLRDLSLSGALVEGYDLPPADTTICLVRGELELSARVAWRRGYQAGLEFHNPMTEPQLLAEVNPTRCISMPPVQ
jgi:hypothetical protein